MIDIQWRPYQVECKRLIKENYDQGITKQLIVAATGVGKRMMAVNLMQHFRRSLFIAHREELIMQAYNEIQNYFPMQVGIIKGPVFEVDKRIVVASVQTLYNRLDRIDEDAFDLVITDEIHHYAARTFVQVARHWNCKLFTGWTATPRRLDGLSLSNLCEKLVFQYDIRSGITDGFLAPIEAYQIKTQSDISRVKKTAGDFNLHQLSEAVDSELRNNLIVQKYKQYTPGRQGIAYCVDMNHAYHLRDMFRENGIKCETVVSDTERCPNRSFLIDRFKGGDIEVLTNVEILTEGFDYPDVGVIMMARPTQSETLYTQCLDDKTEILTNGGWKTVDTISYKNKVAGYNIKTKDIQFLKINEIFKRKRGPDESMYSISLPGLDIRVTGGHRMIQSKKIGRKAILTKEYFINASDFADNKSLVRIPVSGYKNSKGLSLTEWELKFLGLFLSDGSYNKTTKQVYIAQSKHQIWNKDIVDILNNCGFEYTIREVNRVTNYSQYSTMLYYYVSNKFTKHLMPFIDKNLNNNYYEINPRQLDHLIYGINLGDGNKNEQPDWTRRTYTISTGNFDFAENLQKTCILNGFRCNIVSRKNKLTNSISWQLHIKPNKTSKSLNFAKSDKRAKFHKEEEYKNEMVWCVSNNLETIITRRNGKVAILGNCMGRATRLKSQVFIEKYGTEKAIVLDFVDNTGKLSLVNAYELEKDVPISDRMFLPEEHKEKLLEEEKRRRERRIKLEAGKDRKVDVLQLPKVQVWNSEKMLEPATEKQLQWIRSAGIFEEGIEYTKLQASELISNLPCQEWQIRYLAIHGYDVSKGASIGQYQKVKSNIENKQKFAVLDKNSQPVSKITDTWEN